MNSISLIIPTIGRDLLRRSIESAVDQLQAGDEIIVVADGPNENALKICLAYARRNVVYLELAERVGDYGCSPCDYGIQAARGNFVFFNGDDDYLVPEAFAIIREAVALNSGIPHLFAMQHTGRCLSNSIEPGAVSGQQIVIPRDMKRMPKMADCPRECMATSDHHFINRVHAAWGLFIYHQEIISVLEYQRGGRME